MDALIEKVAGVLRHKRLCLHDEKELQREMHKIFLSNMDPADVERELPLDKDNIIDFRIFAQVGVEVKIKGQKRAIYKQCVRYCEFDQIKTLLLVTNKSMGFPEQINGKDCYVLNLGRAWL